MRNEKALIKLLRRIVDLLSDECERNPQFANQFAALLADLPISKPAKTKVTARKSAIDLPDIHAEWSTRGEENFRLWLRDQPIIVLRAVIRQQGFDPTRRTAKWNEVEKLTDFIATNLRARLSRGAAFIRSESK